MGTEQDTYLRCKSVHQHKLQAGPSLLSLDHCPCLWGRTPVFPSPPWLPNCPHLGLRQDAASTMGEGRVCLILPSQPHFLYSSSLQWCNSKFGHSLSRLFCSLFCFSPRQCSHGWILRSRRADSITEKLGMMARHHDIWYGSLVLQGE